MKEWSVILDGNKHIKIKANFYYQVWHQVYNKFTNSCQIDEIKQ